MNLKISQSKVCFYDVNIVVSEGLLSFFSNLCTDWTEEEAQMPEATTHLWEESWDDDDTSEEFLAQLKYDTVFSIRFI